MVLARWQATIVDGAGNIQPGASIDVRREDTGGALVSLFGDRQGTTPIGNPFAADEAGFAAFHVPGGAYRITATKGAFSQVWRYVAIGLAAESDSLTTGISWFFDPATADADPGDGELRFNNAVPAAVTQLYIDTLSRFGGDVGAWLAFLDDNGMAANRGTLVLQTADGAGLLVATVTGAVVDGGGYRKVNVTPVVASGAFAAGAAINVQFTAGPVAGVDGLPAGLPFTFSSATAMADPGNGVFRLNNAALASVTAAAIDDLSAATGNPDVSAAVLSWDDSTNTANRGTLLIKSVAAPQNYALYRITGLSTDNAGWTQLALTHVASAGSFTNGTPCSIEFAPAGAPGVSSIGKQTIWVPAAAMYKNNPSAGPSTGQFGAGATIVNYLAFDPATLEDAFFTVAMPKSWDLGPVSGQFYWFHPATSTNFTVLWTLYAQAYGDGDPITGVAYGGSGLGTTDIGGAANTLYVSPEGAPFTVGGAPAVGDWVHFVVRRLSDNAADTLAVDALLIGVKIFFTTNAATDA
jgi:hypothetical protein